MFCVIRGGMETKDLVGYVKVKLETPSPASRWVLSQINPHIICQYHMPEIGVLTRTYFAEGQVPNCPDVTSA